MILFFLLNGCDLLTSFTHSQSTKGLQLNTQFGNNKYKNAFENNDVQAGGTAALSNQQNVKDANNVMITQGLNPKTMAITVLVFGAISALLLFIVGFLLAISIVIYLKYRDARRYQDVSNTDKPLKE